VHSRSRTSRASPLGSASRSFPRNADADGDSSKVEPAIDWRWNLTSRWEHRINELSLALLERLNVEVARPPGEPSTTLVGGIVKAGSKLDALLREVIVYVAEVEAQRPEDLLARVGRGGGSKPNLRNANAGPLAYGLKEYFASRSVTTVPLLVRSLVQDLVAGDSAILSFITVRNEIAKQGGDPSRGRPAAARLRRLIEDFRRTIARS